MLLYDFELAPNPRRVRMFLAEKGIEMPRVQVNLRQGEQFHAQFMRDNPAMIVPARPRAPAMKACLASCREPPLGLNRGRSLSPTHTAHSSRSAK